MKKLTEDEKYMKEAIRQAKKALLLDESSPGDITGEIRTAIPSPTPR